MSEMTEGSAKTREESATSVPASQKRGNLRLFSILRFLLFAMMMGATLLLIQLGLKQNPATERLLKAAQSGTLNPLLIWTIDAAGLAAVLFYSAIAARREKASLAAYGLPLRGAFGKRWGAGLLLGFGLASLDICMTWLLGGYSFGGIALSPSGLLKYGLLWAGAFILTGIYEEYLYRGYALYTLGGGLGFWPAAIVLAAIFGGLHLLNSGESPVGALDVVAFALFASFLLLRTGSLWFAIGVHTAWDFSLTFIFSVPGSGLTAEGMLLHSSLHGSVWLTGGSAGPEGSIIGVCVLLAAFPICIRLLPQRT